MKTERCVIYASGHRAPDQYSRHYVPVFNRLDKARAWLIAFLNGKPYTREGDTLIYETDPGHVTSMTVKLRSEQLDRILDAPVGNEELEAEQARWILRFKHGTWDEVHSQRLIEAETSSETVGEAVVKAKQEKTARDKAPDGWISITEICAGTSIKPMHARAALRANRQKPSFGWSFDPKEVSAIKQLIGA